jgi:hypothetical protein
MTCFLMNQTFPENWFRAAAPVLGSPIPAEIAAALPQWVAGRNDENGVFVADPSHHHRSISVGCVDMPLCSIDRQYSSLIRDVQATGISFHMLSREV